MVGRGARAGWKVRPDVVSPNISLKRKRNRTMLARTRTTCCDGNMPRHRSGATAAAPGGTGQAVLTCSDGVALQELRRDVAKVQRVAVADLHAEHLVGVAVVNLAHPADAQRRATQQARAP